MDNSYKSDKNIVEGWKNILKKLKKIETIVDGDTTIRQYKDPKLTTLFQWVFNSASGWNWIEVVTKEGKDNVIQCAWEYIEKREIFYLVYDKDYKIVKECKFVGDVSKSMQNDDSLKWVNVTNPNAKNVVTKLNLINGTNH